jgi:Phytanoyl-CoA dioxygenase (PhyH)
VVAGGQVSSDALAQLDRFAAANRLNRSAETDELLLKLRLDAASQIPRQHIDTTLEPPSEDLFAGTTRLPEIDASHLTAAHLASGILVHGALLVRGLVGAKHLDVLTAGLDESDASAQTQPPPSAGGYKSPGSSGVMCSPATLHDVIEMYKDIGLGETISEYLGERPVLLANRVAVFRNRAGSGLPWHQDAAFFGGVFRAVNVWLAISPCGVDTPGLSVIPRRLDHVCGVEAGESLPLPLKYGRRFTREIIREIAGDHQVLHLNFQRGDALLFDELTMHRTSPRDWKFPYRDGAASWFFAPSRFPSHRTPLVF